MSDNEVMEILKKYDKPLYEYYKINAWYLGPGAKRWAERLKKENEEKE